MVRSLLFLLAALTNPAFSFLQYSPSESRALYSSSTPRLLSSFATLQQQQLLQAIEEESLSAGDSNNNTKESTIEKLLTYLEESYSHKSDNDTTRFDELLDLYNVNYTLTSRYGDNPVGGRWTRKNGMAQAILNTRRTLQHLVPKNSTGLSLYPTSVAEAVNVIKLDALFGLLQITVILRGDAMPLTSEERDSNKLPLSNLAVRARFDPPRVVIGGRKKRRSIVNVNVGPRSSVILDTKYVDSKIRIGMGGTSGTRFVFGRCPPDDEEAKEFKALLGRPPIKRVKAAIVLTVWMVVSGLYGYGTILPSSRFFPPLLRRLIGYGGTMLGSLSMALVFSAGGIEQNDLSYRQEKIAAEKAVEALRGTT